MDDSFAAASAGLGISFAIQMIVVIGVYVWLSLALMAMFRKTGSAAWKAWIPVVREWELLRLARMNPIWSIFWYVVPLLYAIIVSVLAGVMFAALLNSAITGTSSGLGWIITGIVVLSLIYLAFMVVLIIIIVTMINRINTGFGLGAGFTVLGVFLYAIWASILGWGSAHWNAAAVPAGRKARANHPTGSMLMGQNPAGVAPASGHSGGGGAPQPRVQYAPPVAPATPGGAPQAAGFVDGQPPAAAAPAAPPAAPYQGAPIPPAPQAPLGEREQPVPPPPPIPPAPPVPPTPPSESAPRTEPVNTPPRNEAVPPAPAASAPAAPAPTGSAGDPWAPPAAPAQPTTAPGTAPLPSTEFAPPSEEPAEPREVTGSSEIVGGPAPRSATNHAAKDEALLPHSDEVEQGSGHQEPIDDRTVLASRSRALGELVLPGGDTVALTSDTVYIGRNPEASSAGGQLVTVPDGTRTISKTHAKLTHGSGQWTITDLDSTNGVVFLDDAGNETEIEGTAPVSGKFLLGDAEFTLRIDR